MELLGSYIGNLWDRQASRT